MFVMNHDLYLWLAKKMYFPIAKYFRFFAFLVLLRWQPTIIAVIGSAGKSNAHNLFFQLLKTRFTVRQSLKANSAFAIPLDVLDIHLKDYTVKEWFMAAIRVPFYTFYRLLFTFKEQFYICELDVDRPGEMVFFASFIKADYIFWVSSYATHTQSFDRLVKKGVFPNASIAVASEFAKLFFNRPKTVGIINSDSQFINQALQGIKFKRMAIKSEFGRYHFSHWQIFRKHTSFSLFIEKRKVEVNLPYIAPMNFGYTILASYLLAIDLKIPESQWRVVLEQFRFNPGVCSILEGINSSRIIDSSYNSSLYATKSLLSVLKHYPGKRKVVVLGDMRELGMESKQQHQVLAKVLLDYQFDQVVLVGPEMQQHVYPILANHYTETTLHQFQNTYQAGLFIKERLLKPNDVLLLKASQNTLFFEIIAELLLANPQDKERLCRRDSVWERKRLKIKDEFYKLIT